MTKAEKKVLKKFLTKKKFKVKKDKLDVDEEDLESPIAYLSAMNDKYSSRKMMKALTQVLGGLGVSLIGIRLVMLAISDPEPTSKLWILLAGGVAITLAGGLSILRALGHVWDVTVATNQIKLTKG